MSAQPTDDLYRYWSRNTVKLTVVSAPPVVASRWYGPVQ